MLLVVDGAQAPGSLAVTLHDTCADIYTVSAHKWMLAPPGSGLVYIHRKVQDNIQANFFDADAPPNQPTTSNARQSYGNDPKRYLSYTHSSGTTPTHTVAGLGVAVKFLEGLGGKKAVQAHNIALRNRLYHGLVELSHDTRLRVQTQAHGVGLRLLSPAPDVEDLCSSIVSFSIPLDFMSAVSPF